MKKKKENQKVKSTRNGVFTLEDLKKVVEEVVVATSACACTTDPIGLSVIVA